MKATASVTRTHNPSGEVRRASCLRENLTSSSYGEGLETGRARTQVPRQLLTRQNRSHWVRDVTFDEDRSQVRTGQGPRMMAILRNLAIAIIRLLGFDSVPQGLRHFAQRPRLALSALGL